MNIGIKEIPKIKKQLDALISEMGTDLTSIYGYECILFRYICEFVLIKSCIDNDLVSERIIDLEGIKAIKERMAKINPEFKKIFKLGEPFDYKFEKRFYNNLKEIFFQYQYENIDFDLIGKLYEGYINKDEKKKLGQFYTPESIIDEILDDVGINESNDKLFSSLILDPACGSGSFIVRMVNRIIKIGLKKGIKISKIVNAVCDNIYGFDIKEFSIYISKVNMLAQLIPLLKYDTKIKIKFNLYVTDSLKNLNTDLGYDYEEKSTILNIKNKRGKINNGFDYIIGNPPYFKAKKLTILQNAYFDEIKTGQLNAYSMFIYMSIRLLKLNGKIGFIIPESIKSGKYFEGIRNYIFNNCTITHLTTFNCRKSNFYDALQGVMIICISKEILDNIEKTIVIKNVDNEKYLLNGNFNNKAEVKYSDVVREINGYRLLLICNNIEYYGIISSIYSNCMFLNNSHIGYKVCTGKLVWNQKKDILTNEVDVNFKNLIWASNIEAYNLTFETKTKSKFNYVKLDKQARALANTGKVILIKRTSTKEQDSRIVACSYDNDDYYFIENHVNYIKQNTKSQIPYNYLLALLNSKLLNFIAKQIMGNTQLSVTEMNLLPIKYSDDRNIKKLLEILNEESDINKLKKLKFKIDKAINKIYGVNIKI